MKPEEMPFNLVTNDEVAQLIKDKRFLGVEVDFFVGELKNFPDELANIAVERITKRGTSFYMGEFTYNKESQTITARALTEVPDYFYRISDDMFNGVCANNSVIGTTFPDFCWLLSEGTTNLNKDELQCPFREGAEFGDLTWMLPAKYVDDMVEMVHVVSNFLDISMQESIIYGPYYI